MTQSPHDDDQQVVETTAEEVATAELPVVEPLEIEDPEIAAAVQANPARYVP